MLVAIAIVFLMELLPSRAPLCLGLRYKYEQIVENIQSYFHLSHHAI